MRQDDFIRDGFANQRVCLPGGLDGLFSEPESAGCLVALAVFKTVVAPPARGEVGSIPTLSACPTARPRYHTLRKTKQKEGRPWVGRPLLSWKYIVWRLTSCNLQPARYLKRTLHVQRNTHGGWRGGCRCCKRRP